MYKQLAAYASALIKDEDIFTPMIVLLRDGNQDVVWGVGKDGKQMYSYLARAKKLSIIGAMRCAHETFETNVKTYNTLDRCVRHVAKERYNKSIHELDHVEAMEVLLTVAKG